MDRQNTAYDFGANVKDEPHVVRTLEALKVWDRRRATDEEIQTHGRQNVGQMASRVWALLYALTDLEVKHGFDVVNAKVLDVGASAGWGLHPFLLSGFRADQLNGIDLFDNRVALGKKICPSLNLQTGDATQMPFADKQFDLVTEQFCFCHVMVDEAREKMAEQMLRVVKPGGYILIMDWVIGSKKRDLNGVSLKKIRDMFEVGTKTEVVERYPAQLFPVIGRPVSRFMPLLYGLVQAVFPFLTGSKITVLRRTGV